MFHNLFKPEYVHILLNPIPVYAIAAGTIVLAAALFTRNRHAQIIALWLIAVSASVAWPVYATGQNAYHSIYLVADGGGQEWLDAHRVRAEKCIYAFYVLAGIALAAALVPVKIPRAATALAVLTLVAAITSMGIGGWVAHAGGRVIHGELRHPVESPDDMDEGWDSTSVDTGEATGGTAE